MASWRDDPGLVAWSAFLRAHAAVVRVVDAQLLERTGMPLAWYDVLLELNAAPDRRLRMLDLGEAVVLSRTRVSRVVDEMATVGLVTRDTNPADRRSAFATLTTKGRAALRRAAPVYLAAVKEHFVVHFAPAEVATIGSSLQRVASVSQSPPTFQRR